MAVDDPFGPLDAAHGYIERPLDQKNRDFAFALLGFFWGLTVNIFLSVWKHTRFGKRPYITVFKVLIWTQLITSIPFFMIEFCKDLEVFPPSFEYSFFVWLLWAIEVHTLTQIQCNRVGILVINARRRKQIKCGVFIYMMVVITFSATSWIPSSLQVKGSIWPIILRPFSLVVSCMIMAIDIALNIWFVVTVRRRLIRLGLTKYNTLVVLNTLTLIGAVSLDALIVGLMYYDDNEIYVCWYPIVYNIKLSVELALSTLIVSIANEKQVYRVKAGGMPSDSTFTENSIYVSHDHETQNVKSDETDLPPAFGQLIRRPDNWQETYMAEEKDRSEKSLSTSASELDTVQRQTHAV